MYHFHINIHNKSWYFIKFYLKFQRKIFLTAITTFSITFCIVVTIIVTTAIACVHCCGDDNGECEFDVGDCCWNQTFYCDNDAECEWEGGECCQYHDSELNNEEFSSNSISVQLHSGWRLEVWLPWCNIILTKGCQPNSRVLILIYECTILIF